MMERIEAIRKHPIYANAVAAILTAEKDRIYCCHTPQHFLDVARIMYIRKLEQKLDLSRELIYATALLHDIGRAEEYTKGTPHDEAGEKMAREILTDCHFNAKEIECIAHAIGDHRHKNPVSDTAVASNDERLARLLKEADNLSRACYNCRAADTCKWSEERKNHHIEL